MKRAFITGVTGQDGAYLTRLLVEKGYEVHGGVRLPEAPDLTNLSALGMGREVRLHRFDLDDPEGAATVLRTVRADEIYNLAAYSSVGLSWEHPIAVARTNALSVAAMLNALRDTGARFCQASTADMFGDVLGPMTEETPLSPLSPYGASKAYAHHLVNGFRSAFGMHASAAILFNHESPLRPPSFVTRKITRGLARFAHGSNEPLVLGNVEACRDWGFAGDYVDAMWRMVDREQPSDYVVATGTATSIRGFVDLTAEALDMSLEWEGEGSLTKARDRATGHVAVEVSERFYRLVDAKVVRGDASRARRELDWAPRVGVAELAAMMVRADRDLLAREGL